MLPTSIICEITHRPDRGSKLHLKRPSISTRIHGASSQKTVYLQCFLVIVSASGDHSHVTLIIIATPCFNLTSLSIYCFSLHCTSSPIIIPPCASRTPASPYQFRVPSSNSISPPPNPPSDASQLFFLAHIT